ncbi:hypothetical protein SteCoe_37573 [Stentor coeruleus]|uniref:Uncharacterized protein n=1 Tax=Stentor coeruleus TaxID=5963 RepID=A0A1R2AN40_9CILI|nr:hypothetical protein SteCoe_37573 [Stentor coeruleus]
MSDDQLEEYRRLMQEKHKKKDTKNDEKLAKSLQEEENHNLHKATARDEEIARKLQVQEGNPEIIGSYPQQYPPPPQAYYSPPPPIYNPPPPVYNPAPMQNQPYYSGYNQLPPQSEYNQSYPPLPRQPQGNYYAGNSMNNRSRESQPLIASQSQGILPEVNDKCCGINTQVLVLILTVLMVIGIIAGVIYFAVE